MNISKVTFFGYADSQESDEEYTNAFESAKLLAQEGFVVVNGGGPGVMRAASLGAKAGGGKTIGVTLYPDGSDEMLKFEGRDELNPIDDEYQTTTYLERTLKLIELGDVYVVMNGGTGTISEFGMAWGLARLHYGQHKHLILFGSWWHDIIEAFGENMRLRGEELKVYHIVDSPIEVVEKVKAIQAL
ncbi:LOG family protein [candidate division WWE3 bacterium]|uniref:LOG family protein n=1 Tax=candidate division WWE3 bacterium TaxID=2053526 RepID=A0A955LK04_UNCKA|nr:LOG family protein [candidate division WWE3 bacterium]